LVFKRRDPRPFWKGVIEFFWPRGGWGRAFNYVKHRLRRLPDTPEKIGRGIWCGVFTSFTPFFGLHFLVSALLAKVMRGNILAALMATFFGNPPTFVVIAATSMKMGNWLLGTEFENFDTPVLKKFQDAGQDLWHNFKAMFTPERADWHGLSVFWGEVFLPYLVGGIVPGIITATIVYYLCVPVIAAYQNRRRKKLREKLAALKNPADAGH
jgi:uncharacterized protein (DUF2062 family)